MKLLVLFSSILALSASIHVKTSIPKDNSHYTEGESRYVWMSDSKDKPVLVDLLEPVDSVVVNNIVRNGVDNQYWLFTRDNPNAYQLIVPNHASTLWSSNFRWGKPIKVLVHGWTNDGNHEMNPLITSAFLEAGDVNVIVVDWKDLASTSYATAVAAVPGVGNDIGDFLIWLMITTRGSWDDVHLVGFSLGAHVVGNAGRRAFGLPARVTGLDPAGPSFNGNQNALDRTSGVYVEAIHTDAGILGILAAIADADFYPNGGRNQPGCSILDSSCSHGRSFNLFAATVRFDHLTGTECSSVLEAQLNNCSGSSKLNLGNHNLDKRGSGIYGLTTESTWPF